jgi:TolB-like protein/DNA-binding winged helix-turn-helix (wHTH) protein/Flp pilus assembly protein TadD
MHLPRLRFDRFMLDLERGCLVDGIEEVALRPKTFSFLRYLATNPGRLVSKDELLAAVWPNVIVSDDSIVQCVTELRRALGDHDQRTIKTVQRRGYRFEAALSVDPRPLPADGPVLSAANDAPPPLPRGPPSFGRPRHTVMLAAIGALGMLAAALGASWGWFGARHAPATKRPPSIVVLPFHNLSDDPGQQYFAAGLTADLTTDLSRLPGAIVIAPATAQTFRGKTVDARQVGRDLNVRYLLTGSVHRLGDEVRLNVQLVDADNGVHLWAERFQREREQIAAWQSEIVGRIANTLNLRLTRLESERTMRERRSNLEAYDLTTRGWALIYTSKKPEAYNAALALFEQALVLDPNALNALAGLGWCSAVSVLNRWSKSPTRDFARAEAAVAQMLALDPNHVVAHHVRGFLLRFQGRPGAARDAFRTALTLNPNFAGSYNQLGMTELELGRPEETVRSVGQAIRLSPRDPNIGHWLANMAMAEVHLGHFTEAASLLARAVLAETSTPTVLQRAYFISALALAGRVTEARATLSKFRKSNPSASIASLRKMAYSKEPGFIAQRERLYEGLRIAGLPE